MPVTFYLAYNVLQNLIHHVYKSPLEALSPRRLALLLMILSIGSLMDLNRPIGSLYGEAYHHLARASICEIPLMEEPDFDVIHALASSPNLCLWLRLTMSSSFLCFGTISSSATTPRLSAMLGT